MNFRKIKYSVTAAALVLTAWQSADARDIINYKSGGNNNNTNNNTNSDVVQFAATCKAASQSADLDVNNVRTKILNGGDMWWDLNNPKYEVPKVIDANTVRKHSLFAGSLWIGGIGKGSGTLRVAAMTYRQKGSDFWPGPIDTVTVATEQARCNNYDRVWKVTRQQLLDIEKGTIAKDIADWPAGLNRSQNYGNETPLLAPFRSASNNPMIYDPLAGDYPVLDDSRPANKNGIKDQPDQMLFFVYNDIGNVHTETSGVPIGLELQTTAFAFATNDEVNNMTFYTTRIINRGSSTLEETYFGQWVDADLGNYSDDYVGCDVTRSLGFCYNGDDDDEGVLGYGLNPPSVGVDFFQGPIGDDGEELGMESFVYYNNDFNPINGNPERAIDYYNYLKHTWKNGNEMVYGGNGVGSGPKTKYMFPGTTDPAFPGQEWTERTAGYAPGDRRFIQSAGPFSLEKGAVNKVTVGVVWARTTSGGSTGSLALLGVASDKAQKLFNNQFDIADGPEPPVVEMQELENELVMKFLDTDISENYAENIVNEDNDTLKYRFQGYLVYQLKDGSVSTGDLENVDKARLIFQCDVKDNIAQLVNLEFDGTVSANIPKQKVYGANKGLSHTVNFKEDLFASGSSKALVNFKTYYYLVMAYGYPANDTLKKDPIQFMPSRSTIKTFGIPHKTEPELGGVKLNAGYGSGPVLKRIAGRGNGGNFLEFSKETIDEILANGRSENPVYLGGNGPAAIKVVDPLKVPNAEFEFYIREIYDYRVAPKGQVSNQTQYQDSISKRSYWVLRNLTTGDSVVSDTSINFRFESLQGRQSYDVQNVRFGPKLDDKTQATLNDWGLAVVVEQVTTPGSDPIGDLTNGLIGFNVSFLDDSKRWLTALPDNDAAVPFNWIRSGSTGLKAQTTNNWLDDNLTDIVPEIFPIPKQLEAMDPNEVYEKIWDRRIAPYALCARKDGVSPTTGQLTYGPAWAGSQIEDNPMSELASVDLVITPDKTKWSQCIVFEMGEDKTLTEGNMNKFNLRWATSKDINGNEIPGERGRSWFPGYAVNLETGERLNIAFGEDSYTAADNGKDMIWNPTSNFVSAENGNYYSFGGKHYVYIMGSYVGMANRSFKGPIYDGGSKYLSMMTVAGPNQSPTTSNKRQVMSQAMWVLPAMAAPGFNMFTGVPLTEVTIKLRVRKPYTKYVADPTVALPVAPSTGPKVNNAYNIYSFNSETIAPNVNKETGKKAVDMINIVPNPYYAFSKYESSAIDARVKITNLPPKVTISIYTLSGTLVRRIKKDNDQTFQDWDLKNENRVPIASGTYIIHVDAGDLGEKVLKWFGVMRQLDLDTY